MSRSFKRALHLTGLPVRKMKASQIPEKFRKLLWRVLQQEVGCLRQAALCGDPNRSSLTWLATPTGITNNRIKHLDDAARRGLSDTRIMSKDEMSASLTRLYEEIKGRADRPHLIVVGNQSGAGRELDPVMKLLSKEFGIDTFNHGGTYAFQEVAFAEEKRQDTIRAAVTAGIKKSKQDDAHQSAIAVESKSEGSEKPKSKLEERSR